MNSSHEDATYLQHILVCIEEVHSHSDGILHFLQEVTVAWDATLRRLQIMAESTTRLSEETKAGMPMIDWSKIKGFRNILVHDYLGDIDPIIVRKIIIEQLPVLQRECQTYLDSLKEHHG